MVSTCFSTRVNLTQWSTLSYFKTKLKTFFFSHHFCCIINKVAVGNWWDIRWLGGNSSTCSVGGTSATQTPCELHSVLRINPYNWTFPNCNISFILDQSIKKTTNESNCYKQHMGKPVLLWEPCYSLGNNTIVWVVWKVRTNILLANVCFEVQCLKSLSILVLHIN